MLLKNALRILVGKNPCAQPGLQNTQKTRWYYVLYVLIFILYNTGMYYQPKLSDRLTPGSPKSQSRGQPIGGRTEHDPSSAG